MPKRDRRAVGSGSQPTRLPRMAGAWLAIVGAAVLVSAPVGARAQSLLPPRVTGSVTGPGKHGDVLTFRVAATERNRAGNLASLRIALQLHSVILDEVTYDRTGNTISTTNSLPVSLGSRSTVNGTFVAVNARSVDISSSGRRLAFTVRARVIQDIPRGSKFSLGAIDDLNLISWVTRGVTVPEPRTGGLSWGTLVLAILVALFAGGFVGNLFSSRRPRVPKISVYDTIRKRMERERARPPA